MSISNKNIKQSKSSHNQHRGTKPNGSARRTAPEVATLAASVPVQAAPKQGAPKPPAGFVKPPAKRGRAFSVQRDQLGCAAMVAAELQAAPAGDFGPHVPLLAPLGAAIALASGWSTERMRADAWRAYVHAQEIAAWTPAVVELDALKPAFEYALLRDPTIADRYPSLALFFGLRKQVAAKAVRTRHAKKLADDKAKAKSAANGQAVVEVPVNGRSATLQ